MSVSGFLKPCPMCGRRLAMVQRTYQQSCGLAFYYFVHDPREDMRVPCTGSSAEEKDVDWKPRWRTSRK